MKFCIMNYANSVLQRARHLPIGQEGASGAPRNDSDGFVEGPRQAPQHQIAPPAPSPHAPPALVRGHRRLVARSCIGHLLVGGFISGHVTEVLNADVNVAEVPLREKAPCSERVE
eukprot:2711605-Pyramimonas_sp.AAC.1